MSNLLLSVLFTTSLGIILKLFEQNKLDVFQAIVFNYISCVLTGMVVQQAIPQYSDYVHEGWFIYAVILGCSFILFFNIMGYVVKQMGISVMFVSNKLSLVIPVGFAFFLFHEEVTALKIAGILLALIAVIFTSMTEEENKHTFNFKQMFWPLLLFIGSGMNDTLVKYAQAFHMRDSDNAPFNITIFSAASLTGFIIFIYFLMKRKSTLNIKSIIGGLLLGVPNYFSMHFLIKALSTPGYGGSVIFPLNNIGVVAASTVIAFIVFHEKLSKLNVTGIALAILSIILIAFSA